jgi:hypothetical protein
MHQVWREVKLAERAHPQAKAYLPLDEAFSSMPGIADPAQAWEASAKGLHHPPPYLAVRFCWRLITSITGLLYDVTFAGVVSFLTLIPSPFPKNPLQYA